MQPLAGVPNRLMFWSFDRKARFYSCPPCGLYFNPVENAFSKLGTLLRAEA
jgi:hypothetical protein